MNKLNNNELKQINGGGAGVYVAIGGIIIFIIGVIDGYVRPLACNR